MLKKLTLLALSVGALVAFAIPASASAVEWSASGEPFEGHTTVELEGHAEFKITEGETSTGVTCKQAKFTVTLVGGTDTGTVTGFSVTNPTTECFGFGKLAPCIPAQPDKEGTWSVTATADTKVTISGIQFKATYHNCPASQIAGGHVLLTPDNAASWTTLSGTGSALGGLHLAADLKVLPPHEHVIGIIH